MCTLSLLAFLSVSSAFAQQIVDNGDPGTSSTGNWRVSGGLNPFGTDSLYANRAGDTYSYTFSVQPGEYAVSAWWTEYSNRVTNAAIDIAHANGADTVTVNHQQNGGQWNALGVFTFASQAVVTVRAVAGGTTSADAIRLEPTGGNGNQAPVLGSIGDRNVTAGEMLDFTISATDANGTIPAFTVSDEPAAATFTDLGNGAASFGWPTTASDAGSSVDVTFTASDGDLTDSETITITVLGQPPAGALIIDNGDAGTSSTGNWRVSGGLNPFGTDSLYANRAGDTYSYTFSVQPG
ncbi:MAG: hypothetical protein ACR2RB_17020, partial [Gammaproteobacteria bacterium]